jgi:hypothetical protein
MDSHRPQLEVLAVKKLSKASLIVIDENKTLINLEAR